MVDNTKNNITIIVTANNITRLNPIVVGCFLQADLIAIILYVV